MNFILRAINKYTDVSQVLWVEPYKSSKVELGSEHSICKNYKQIQSKVHNIMQSDIFRFQASIIDSFLNKVLSHKINQQYSIFWFRFQQICGNGKCSPGGFPSSLPCQSTAIFLLIQVITETTKRNKHTRQKHKKVKGKYMIQGIPGFLLEESLFNVTSLTIASSSLVCRGRGCIGAILCFIIFFNLAFN
jgi:hypothetical protein